jgi:hypothetical protein
MTAIARRAFLTSAAALPLAGATHAVSAAPSAIPPEIVALIAEVRRVYADYQAKITFEMSIEGKPGYEAAVEASAQGFDQWTALVDRIAERPVLHWSDLLPLAVVAELEGLEHSEQAPALLVEGMLQLAGASA